MIKTITAAVKKMAQRSMMRGNIGAAETITSLGQSAALSNIRSQPQNVITQKTGGTGVHEVFVQQNVKDIKQDISGSHHSTHKDDSSNNKKLGSSIMDALD